MKEKARYFFAGLFIGLAELLPGISGATVALMFGVYEKLLSFINKLEGFNIIIPLIIGMIISVIGFSNVIAFLYENFESSFNLAIGALMIGYGSVLCYQNLSKTFPSLLLFSLFALIGIVVSEFLDSSVEVNNFLLIVYGFIAFSFLIIPGISGSAFLVAIGIYNLIIKAISDFDFSILVPFGIGMLISLIIIPRLIERLISKYQHTILLLFAGIIFGSGLVISGFYKMFFI
tara:strand:- start:1416 stop:2111 length:696 start_codon:yes stop_codon:yes gene_type:complete